MIGYPNKKRTMVQNNVRDNYMGRGMSLEDDLNKSNAYYMEMKRALIHKKPIPIQIVKVDYPQRSSAKIVEAYYKTPSTTDYNGIYRGKAIDFEAKETKSKTSFPFKNFHPHQIKHLEQVLYHGGIGFVIIRFSYYDETYLIDAKFMIDAYYHYEKKSIPYETIKNNGSFIRQGLTPRLAYLDNVDECYFKEDDNNESKTEKIK
ncbi:MAG: Holliday junction resolvase RecU [Erysipelotrichaceae bacterium]|nr:Holliday junction resolvase RecU [Erysipelotrichaceae bacterium]